MERLIGGAFLALAYFGCDQSQVQRYLTGKSIAQSRLSLIFTATVKIPMQLFILFIGAMVFVLSLFMATPMIFHPLEAARAQTATAWPQAQTAYQKAFEQRRESAYGLAEAMRQPGGGTPAALSAFRNAQSNFLEKRQGGVAIVEQLHNGETLTIRTTFFSRL